jgi:hypothetical protein
MLKDHLLYDFISDSLNFSIPRVTLKEYILVEGLGGREPYVHVVNNRAVKEKILVRFLLIYFKEFYSMLFELSLNESEWKDMDKDDFIKYFKTLLHGTIHSIETIAKKEIPQRVELTELQAKELIAKFRLWHNKTLDKLIKYSDVILSSKADNEIKLEGIMILLRIGLEYTYTDAVESYMRLNSFMDSLQFKTDDGNKIKNISHNVRLKEYIRQGNLGKALHGLYEHYGHIDSAIDKPVRTSIIMLQSQYNETQRRHKTGVINEADYRQIYNKILEGVVDLIDELFELENT